MKNFRILYTAAALITVLSTTLDAQYAKKWTSTIAGEIHYNSIVQNSEIPMSKTDRLDFHKLALKSAYKISDHWSAATKVIVEHAFDQHYKGGDVYVSNAYLKYKISKKVQVTMGLQSVPIEAEKPGSYGTVEISSIEKYLSHAWREFGIKLSGSPTKNIDYQLMVGTGLHAAELGAKSVIYNARNSSLSNSVQNVAFGGKFVLNPTYSWQIGTSLYYSSLENSNQTEVNLSGTNYKLAEIFTRVEEGNLEARLIGVYSSIKNSDAINNAIHNKVGASQYGVLIELGYDFSNPVDLKTEDSHLKGFVRTEFYDPYYRTSGFNDKPKYEHIDYSLGIVYQPFKSIEIKADYVIMRSGAALNEYHFDVSLGFHL